jgi:hypothetical protein
MPRNHVSKVRRYCSSRFRDAVIALFLEKKNLRCFGDVSPDPLPCGTGLSGKVIRTARFVAKRFQVAEISHSPLFYQAPQLAIRPQEHSGQQALASDLRRPQLTPTSV